MLKILSKIYDYVILQFNNILKIWKNTEPKQKILLLIITITLLLIMCNKDGYHFGIIAIIIWTYAYLDLARIKFNDYEIDFMNKNEALTEDERNIFINNYKLLVDFQNLFLQHNAVTLNELNLIKQAYDDALLYLPEEICKYLENILITANKSYAINHLLEHEPVGEKRSKLVDQEVSLNQTFIKMKPFEIYRKYIKIVKE